MADFPPVVYASDTDKDVIARAVRRGDMVRVGPGIYFSDTEKPVAALMRQHLWDIVGRVMPGAVIVDRSVRDGALGADGSLYVVADRTRPLNLAGVTVYPRRGCGPLEGDMDLPAGVHMAGVARSLLENLAPTRLKAIGGPRTLTREEVETWIAELCTSRGELYLNRTRDEARRLAPQLGADRAMVTLDKLISAALNTNDSISLTSAELIARASGAPFDAQRVTLFSELAEFLNDQAPDVGAAMPIDADRRKLLPFYEAYFSNYIEGTEFTLDEASEIVFDGVVPDQRPADAHDILGTYELTNSVDEMRRTPKGPDEYIDLLRSRHAVIMGGRPDRGPGQFKNRANRAGNTEFVDPAMVEGTLRRGFDIGAGLVSPFARATYMMFVTAEVHPFADGNGRTARIMMNAELAAAGEVRIIIPTVYRLNYLAALKAATHGNNFAALLATLSFARRWTGRIDFTNRATAESDFARTSALRDAKEAEDAGIRLVMP